MVKRVEMTIKDRLRNIIDPNENRWSRVFDFFISFMVVASVITFSIETIPSISEEEAKLLYFFELFSVGVFSIEYLLRIYAAKKRLSYIFSFYGIIDLLAIAPFYLSMFIDLRAVKIFRLFRLIRLFKLTRYSKTVNRFLQLMKETKEEFILFFILTIILFYLSSVGIYYFEHEAQPEVFSSIFDSMWWAVATLMTVGYGDTYPITAGGKIFTTFILMIGLSVVSIPAGIISSALSGMKKKGSS